MDAWPADSWATRKPVHHYRLRRLANRRKTTIKVSLLDRVLEVMRDIVEILLQYALYLWEHNPVKVLSRRHRRLYFVENYGEIMIKPKFRERVLDLLLSDSWRRQRLLNWVHKRLGLHVAVVDFSTSWQDGTALCALLESICPGVCPSYHLLPTHNRVKNCRLGLKLANKYLYLPMDLVSAEEMSIAARGTEQRLIQYVSMVKWASENIRDKWSALHESLIAAKSGRCFAKGLGLKSGIVDKKCKFTVLVSDTIGVFNLLVEVRGPNHEYCGERIVSLHQAKALLDKSFDYDIPQSENIRYLEDCAGNTFVRKKVSSRYAVDAVAGDQLFLDVQCGDEGTFYVTYVPKRAGMHTVAIKWQNHHVESSPFRAKVYKASAVSVRQLKGAKEKRVIYDSLSFSSTSGDFVDALDSVEDIDTSARSLSPSAISKTKAYSKGRQLTVTRRRVLRRIITRNGVDIVIEEAISPSLSRQSSINDNSDDDSRQGRYAYDDKVVHDSFSAARHALLGTVPEERGSKDSDVPVTSKDEKQSRGSPRRSPHKCKEINEHNQLEKDAFKTYNPEQNHALISMPVDRHNDEQQPDVESHRRSPKTILKRTPLHRTTSIHPYKSPARRTKSDGPLYIRRNLCTYVDSDSEASSDGSYLAGTRAAHSSDHKSKGMDLSDDAFSRTFSISAEEDPLAMDRSLFLGQGKTKLRASQSMPLMHKYWQRDAVTDETLHCLIQRLETVKSEVDKLEFPVTSSGSSACSHAVRSADSSSSSSIGNNFGNVKENVLNLQQQAMDNNNELSDNVREDARPIYTEGGRRRLSKDVVPPTPSAILRAAGLTRQFLVTKSSGESSSEKTDSVEKQRISLDSGAGDPTSFKANYEHSPSVVIPKAKVDKMTQVSAAEITSATGWDMIEKVYILLQGLTLSSNTDIGRTNSLNDKVESGNSSSKQKSIRIMNVSDVSQNVHLENTTTAHNSTSDERKGLQGASWHDNPGSLDNVNAWFEKNRQLMHTLRTPPRQATVETIDSGFDDNTAPFSRRGRLSLPSLRTASGHTRLYRQSYKGPKYPFEPSLVNSGSSQSISVERGELGNEADDELIRGQDSLGKLPARQMRRRHRRINREDSLSLSDSELHERRKRMKRRTYTLQHSVSRVMDSSSDIEQQRQHFREIFLSPTKNAFPSFSVMSCTEDMLGWNSAMEKTDVQKDSPNVPKRSFIRPGLRHKSTTDSMDSNYAGFGVSKPHRKDLLSHLDAFQRLCPTEEEASDYSSLQESKFTHWNNEQELISCSDDNSRVNALTGTESEPQNDTETTYNGDYEQQRNLFRFQGAHNASDHSNIDLDARYGLQNIQIDPEQTTFFDIFASIDRTVLDDSVVSLGDTFTLDTGTSMPMTVRLNGAGLRFGTVNHSNSFQVWVDNPIDGSLSVVVAGSSAGAVRETSVMYTGDNLYEAAFTVTLPGIYNIYVKWGDKSLTETPYVCDVTL